VTKRLCLGLLASFVAVAAASTPAAAQQQQKPNILFIMGDDIGWMQPRKTTNSNLCKLITLLDRLSHRPTTYPRCPPRNFAACRRLN